jgi:L-alanine-DL-glutamate epimerase-like enolase superfamily enzyme
VLTPFNPGFGRTGGWPELNWDNALMDGLVDQLQTIRDAVGPEMAIMVDVNQGWRMPGDRTPAWDVGTATQLARALEPRDVYWLEEPVPCSDVEAYAELRSATGIRIAAGEMVRTEHEARDLIMRGGVDVIQCDVVLAGGIEGCRRISELADASGGSWSPHTWSHGHGLLANLHAALGFSSCRFLEVPYDPPGWTPERREFPLPTPVEVADGTLQPPQGPGLGVEPDLEAIERWRVA